MSNLDPKVAARLSIDSALRKFTKHYRNLKKGFEKSIIDLKKQYPGQPQMIKSYEDKVVEIGFNPLEKILEEKVELMKKNG